MRQKLGRPGGRLLQLSVSEIIDRSESESDVGASRHGKTWSLSW